MEELFREKSQPILLFVGIESDLDPFEHNVSVVNLNPLPIDAIVTDLTMSKIQWSMPSVITDRAKEIVIEAKYKTALEQSQQIQILGDTDIYHGWRINGKLQYRVEGDYLRASIYIKKES